ncbi:MAG: DUF624 domain-containing protein [Streptococcaceae bacterium]|jgi:hypothetical protein|nr:DUF624 domain-containing protein [Streptococcaceae bacterium]
MDRLRFNKQKFDDNVYMKLIHYIYCFLMANIGLILVSIPLFVSINFLTITTKNIWLFLLSMVFIYPGIASVFAMINHYLEYKTISPFRFFFQNGLKKFGAYGLKYGIVTTFLLTVFSVDLLLAYSLPLAQLTVPFLVLMIGLSFALCLNMLYFRVRNQTAKEKDIFRAAAYYLLRKWYVSLLNVVLFLLMFSVMFVKPQFGFIITPSIFLFIIYLNCGKLYQKNERKVEVKE